MKKRKILKGAKYKVIKPVRYTYVAWISQMNRYVGEIATVTYVSNERHSRWVKIDLDKGQWCWDVNSLEEYREDLFTDKDFLI